MVCVAGEGQGTLEIWDLAGGGDEPPKKSLKMPQSVRVAELVSRVLRLCKYKIGSVGLILQWDRNKVDLMYVRRDLTIAEIGVDFTSGTTYRLLITEWLPSLSELDEQKMPCVDGGDPSVSIEVLDLTVGGVPRTNLEIGPATTVTGLFRLIEVHHEPGTFGLLLRCRRNKIKLNDKDPRKLTEVGLDLSSLATVMLLVTEPADSPSTTPTAATTSTTATTATTAATATTMTATKTFRRRDGWRKIPDENEEFEDPFSTELHPDPPFVFGSRSRDSKLASPVDGMNLFDDIPAKAESERIEEQGHEDVEPNRRSENAYVGLVNQAMTCYLNSLLQALYMTPEFRNALYNWEYRNGSEKDQANSIPYQLQKLFLNLQTSPKTAIETTSLTKSFGWDSTEAWQQHDIQELCRVMFDALEQKFKNTAQADLINRLYEGKMIDYVKCLECGTEKSREDTFLDIPLPVRPFGSNVAYNSVQDALNAFVQPETLDGTNQYHCDTCNKKCDAHKGLKFTKFPYLLTLHLKRFDFDYNTFHRIKLNDEVTFPDVLNLNCFIPSTENERLHACIEQNDGSSVGVIECEKASATESVSVDDKCPPCDNGMSVSDQSANHDHDDDSGIDLSNGPSTSSCSTHNHDHDNDKDIDNDNEKNQANRLAPPPTSPKGPYEYELFSIMIHSGSASGGHYYAYIKDFRTGEWLCFNDQNVSPITYDDIQKTYGGGPARAYYSGVYSSSTNAYMLMYRQIDPKRNTLPMQVKDFPQHLKELLLKMQENHDANYREYLTQMYRLKVLCRRPNEDDRSMSCIKLCCRHDETWGELTARAYLSLSLDTVVPRDQVRLVTYQENTGMIECSFEGREEETIHSILDDRRDLLMEIREKDEKFETYMPGGVASKVYVVDVAKKEVVVGPINVRGLVTQTVSEYKIQLSQIIGIEAKDIHLIVQYPNNPNARLITKNDSSLLDEGFGSGDKIFVPIFLDVSTPTTIKDGLYEIMEIFGGLISLNFELPDISEESLRESNIPSLAEKNKEKVTEAPLTNGPSKGSPVNDGPLSPPPPPPPPPPPLPPPPALTSATSTVTTTTTTTADQEEPVVNETAASAKSEEFGGLWSETTSPPNTQGAEGEEWHTPEQSNSEDSSLSYSDRTLVGEGDASEDDDYPLAGVEHELFHQTEQEKWDIEDPSEYYFRATPHPDRLLRVLVDKRMSLGTLKKLLEPYVGVPMEYFKIHRQSDSPLECIRLNARLNALKYDKEGEMLYLKLGRALRSCELKLKLYQLLLDDEAEPYRNLCEWIVSKDATVGQTKKEILVELKKKFDIDIPFERCRLRRKNYKTAAKVFLDDQKFKDLSLYWPYEVIVQELPGKEPVTDQNDVVIITRRERRTPTFRLDPNQELVVSGKSIAELREKLSQMSGIPEEYLEIAKGKSSLPSDFTRQVLQNTWYRQSTTPDNCPEINFEDGMVIYYRDWREKENEPSAEEGQDIKSKSKSRMLGISSSSRYSPRRERALKIYIDDK